MNPETHLRHAIRIAVDNAASGRGGPFGAVIAAGETPVATGVNEVTSTNDPTAHAEIQAIRAACRTLGTHQLRGYVLYSSCEPCPMCLAAIYWARLDALWYASTRQDAAAAGFDDSFLYDQVPLDPPDRTLPTRLLLRDEGAAAFEAWNRFAQRIPY